MRSFLRNTLAIALIFSLFMHFSVWLGTYLVKEKSKPQKKETVEIVLLDQRPKTDAKKMQIVEQADKAFNDETPEDAKYLSKNNQSVVKETRAQNTGEFRNANGVGTVTGQQPQQAQKEQKKSNEEIKDMKGGIPTLADLRPKLDLGQPQKEVKEAPVGNGGPASQTNDFLKDTDPSLETLLNTREFVYYTYYQRIRGQIRQYWEPSIREKVKKIFASGRNIASEKDHVTRVIIILNKEGHLLNVQVIGESGVSDLDDAAVDAFRAAEPFPNPPKGIIEADGMIRINWDFILEADISDYAEYQRYASK